MVVGVGLGPCHARVALPDQCAGAFAAPSVNSANTFCKEVWPGCVDKLAANIKADDKLPANILPAWLSRKVTTTDVASTQFELKAEAEAAASAKAAAAVESANEAAAAESETDDEDEEASTGKKKKKKKKKSKKSGKSEL